MMATSAPGAVVTVASTVVMVHNLGHHELYLEVQNDGYAGRYRLRGLGNESFGKALVAALQEERTALQPRPDGSLALSPPLTLRWDKREVANRLASRSDESPAGTDPVVTAVYLPLAAAVLAQTRLTASASFPDGYTLHAVLVSTGPEREARAQQTSTARVAEVLLACWATLAPDVQVCHVHRTTDAPTTFDTGAAGARALDAQLCALRRPMVAAHGEDWAKHFRVYVSANTGTVSQIVSVLEGLRVHRPALLSMPAAYAWPFGPDGALVPHEVVVLSPDDYAQRPARPASTVDDEVQAFAIAEMRQWRSRFASLRPVRAADSGADAEASFWFRKGKKEVLAVLVVRDQATGALVAHRGVNLEVSLPTGTLCAERNAIGTAFTAHPNLRRQDIEAVAVLSLDDGLGPRLGPCGACTEWLRKVAEINPDFRVLTFQDLDCERVFVDPVDV